MWRAPEQSPWWGEGEAAHRAVLLRLAQQQRQDGRGAGAEAVSRHHQPVRLKQDTRQAGEIQPQVERTIGTT